MARRQHRANPSRRRRSEPTYKVDVWRSLGALLTDESALDGNARKILAAMLIDVFGQGADARIAAFGVTNASPWTEVAGKPGEFLETIRELHRAGFLGVEDGVAFMAYPERDALGRIAPTRIPDDQRTAFTQAMAESLKENFDGGDAS